MRRRHDAPRSVFANLAVLVDDRWYEPNKERPAETIWCERVILTTFQKNDLAIPLDLNRYSVIRSGNYPDRQFHRTAMDAFAAADLACGKLREAAYLGNFSGSFPPATSR